MVAIDTTRSAAPAITGRIIAAIFNVFAAISAWNDARATTAALSKLSDRELDDIGLCRGDIYRVAHN